MKCPNDYSKFDDLKDECLECPQYQPCKEGKFQSKEVVKRHTYAVAEEWYPYFIDELLSLKSEYYMREAELRMMFYHELGRRLIEEVLENKQNKGRAQYGEKILHECVNFLNISISNIYSAIKFYRMYPKLEDCPAVNWSKAKKLIANDGDTKVLSECLHKHTEMRKFCKDCHRQVK